MTTAEERKSTSRPELKNRGKMRTRIIYTLILLLVSVLISGDSRLVSAENQVNRIRFQVTTIGESASERKILAQTTIEGLPGTDFNINLQTENFKMQTRFMSDLIGENNLKIRAKLDTRRFYGFSPANLPLYEEDSQKHSLEIGFDETLILLPFGRGAETLKIEITPTMFSIPKTDVDAKKLKISFDKHIPSGEIFIEASKIPHRFEVEAVLLADGKAIAKGSAACLLEEEQTINLQMLGEPENQNYAAKLTIDKFSRTRPNDLVGINFGFYSSQPKNQMLLIVSNGAGIGELDKELVYRLEGANLPDNRKYELKFKVRLLDD